MPPADLSFLGESSTSWELTQAAAIWLSRRCHAPMAAVYLAEEDRGQVLRGLHRPPGAPDVLPARLWWKGEAAWTSWSGPTMRVVPFSIAGEAGVFVVGPFLPPHGPGLAESIDTGARVLVAPLLAALARCRSAADATAREDRVDLLEAVAYQLGAGLDGTPGVLLDALRDQLGASRVAWENDALVIEGAGRTSPAVESVEWWVPLLLAANADPDGGPTGVDEDTRRRSRVALCLLGLSEVVDGRDPATAGRSAAVADLALRLGTRLGLDAGQLLVVEEAARMHRIGALLLGSDPDVEPDPERMAVIGACLLAGAGCSEEVVRAVRHLHERWDGNGGPDALTGTAVPVEARILAVAVAWEELLSWHRPCPTWPRTPAAPASTLAPAAPWSRKMTARRMVAGAGSQFDPRAVGALLEETDAPAAI